MSVVGTRPQLIKAAALQPILRREHHEVFVDTGQHWDDELAGTFFRELDLARPDHALGAGGGSHAEQTAAMLRGLEPVLIAERPDAVLVFGDTNSTLAGALAASKLDIPVAHVEAGLRSFDRRMPEEVNRVVADHLSRWLFAPTPTAVENLAAEGISDEVLLVGDLMQDLAARVVPSIQSADALASVSRALGELDLQPGRFVFATIHRQENRSAEAIARWTPLLRALAGPDRPIVLSLHPGTRAALEAAGGDLGPDVRVVPPQGYATSLALQLHAAAIVTDSGGIQREAAWLGVPCLVLRSTTEWQEAMAGSSGAMVTVGLDVDAASAAMARLAPPRSAPAAARARAAGVRVVPAGAAEAISARLAAGGGGGRGGGGGAGRAPGRG